jgi:hypothetical protein
LVLKSISIYGTIRQNPIIPDFSDRIPSAPW